MALGLSGTLPVEFGNSWPDLRYFNVGSNKLSGTLPSAYSKWSKLKDLVLEFNRFEGTLPAAYAALTELNEITVGGNALSGTLPQSTQRGKTASSFISTSIS